MGFSKTCLALVALWLTSSSLVTAAAAPSRGSWSLVSSSFSASLTTEHLSTTATRESLTDEVDISQHTSRTKSSHSCPNVFCLPISPWTKTEARQTSTSASSTHHSSSSTASSAFSSSSTSPSACLQQMSPSKTPSPMRFNFTDACDADTPAAEDCRVTLSCDTSLALFPTCDRGQCECLSKECFRKSMCEDLRQCRDYDEAICMRDNSSSVGVCGCRPRVTGCLFEESPHRWCGRASNCTERHFSLYPEFPYCSTGDRGFPLGKCECRFFGCERTGDERDYESCRELIDCEESPLGKRAYCGLKYGDERKGAEDGYCTCGE
ncbi:hypothetical protein M419DRAFT_80645 [Trichoderma reesei RUT C-30]|uniref:Uncharacterized protein n=1 Tax=Hypocrea jecorina (strain ATCC 56765 / BCRC 32924 / NRRL 11460 / Rut C-30) TaxID=1344414 RepID=A0A024S8R8_HYPJR|nr:hypothetical protein M419DRAFT_80645 [Trichoderma reesei RUT C-30]